jgi:hypothetical protein
MSVATAVDSNVHQSADPHAFNINLPEDTEIDERF